MSRTEFLLAVLRLLFEQASAPGVGPVSLQASLIVQQLQAAGAFADDLEAAANQVIGRALNLELAVEGDGPLEPARAAAIEALEQFTAMVLAPPRGAWRSA